MHEKGRRLLLLLLKLTRRSSLCFVWLASGFAFAEIVNVESSGQYSFGPNTSEQQACELAREQLISNAARSHFGERIEFDETQLCSSAKARSSGIACDLDQRMFFSLDENLSVIDVRASDMKVLYPQESKLYSCNIIGTVRFEYSKSSIDRSWVTSLKVDNQLLNKDKRLAFTAKSSKKGFHYIFEDEGPRGFSLIYPNELDGPRKIGGAFSVPSSLAKRSYNISAGRSDAGVSGEFLRFFMLSTKKQLSLKRQNTGLISREQMALLKEELQSGAWTEKKIGLQIVY
jgi:hypothetical protein